MHDIPENNDDERAALGSIFLNRDAIVLLASWFTAALFYQEKHALIYEAMLVCHRKNITPNVRIVADMLRDQDRLDGIGGLPYLLHLDDGIPHGLDAEVYARRVESLALRRQLLAASSTIAVLAQREHNGPQAVADAQAEIAKVAAMHGRGASDGFVPFRLIVDEVYDDLDTETAPGLATGFRDLDSITGGLHGGDLIILGARPSVGKSSWAGCLACNVAALHRRPVAVASLEMGRKELLKRAASAYIGVDLAAIRDNVLSDEQRTAFMKALGWAAQQSVYVNHDAGQTTQQIRSHMLRMQAEHGQLGLIVVDYLQLMRGTGKKERWQEVGEFSTDLKRLARELDTPVLALSQLSRGVEGRTSKVPMLSDLRESGNLEQDADIVMFLYREELYDKETDKKGIAEIHIAKHRNGAVGVVPMRFEASTTRFSDLSYRQFEGY